MWQVPIDFLLPADAKLHTGWLLWVKGQPGYKLTSAIDGEDNLLQSAPIRPYRYFKRNLLPKEVRQNFSLSWAPIYGLMSGAPGMNFDLSGNDSFKIGYKYLVTRVQYIFRNKKIKPDSWRVSYWSMKVQRSSIMKNGTDEDKAQLPEESKRNRKRNQKNTSIDRWTGSE